MTLDLEKTVNLLEDLEIEDQLSYLTADLVEYKSNQKFLDRLFAHESGKWTDIYNLCHDLNSISDNLKDLEKACQGILQVTWLDYPSNLGEGYCLIIFYLESLHWSNMALHCKTKLSEVQPKL
ncbi:MAG TPA: hypothetical protein DCF68_05220 [Cyanothece sp. UBA12306]|nr:hypothetical protein [Cyanothece sp. UBA12306]